LGRKILDFSVSLLNRTKAYVSLFSARQRLQKTTWMSFLIRSSKMTASKLFAWSVLKWTQRDAKIWFRFLSKPDRSKGSSLSSVNW